MYAGSKNPRWLIVNAKFVEAFHTLVTLRRERLLAAEELCYTYFQVRAERAIYRWLSPDLAKLSDIFIFC